MKREPEARAGSTPADPRARSTGPRTILLATDSETVLLMQALVLSQNGYHVIGARDGRECLEKAVADAPDLIVVDMAMQQMDAADALASLRSDPATQHIPLLVAGTLGELKRIDAALARGSPEYIVKPFTGLELLVCVRRRLGEWLPR